MARGSQVTNASRRERGLRRLEVWIPAAALQQLDAICEESGWSRAEIIQDMITGESEEASEMRPRAP
jgi:hypothetical protein